MDWGHYGETALEFVFVLVMIAWNLLALDAVQQIQRMKRKRKEKAQWRSC
jgi:hypothetical protein